MEKTRFLGISLCVLVTGAADARAFDHLVTSLFDAGVRMLQIRDKELSDDVFFSRVRAAMAIGRKVDPALPPLVIVNDRVHVAASAGADGAHVGALDMPVAEARTLFGDTSIIGRTAHTLVEAREALASGADYLGVGPCFPSTTKEFASHASPDFLAQAARLPLPVFAIGGITLDRLSAVRSLGIERIAVAAAITSAPEPAVAARRFLDSMTR